MKSVTNLRGMIFTKDCVFEPGELVIEDGIIKEVRTCEYEALVQKEQERYLIPGLVDVHLHGAVGYDFCDGTKEALQAIAAYENEHGITTICPATMSLPVTELEQILTAATEWKKEQAWENSAVCENGDRAEERILAQNLRGIHLEGPFIAKEKKGAQKEEYIIPFDKDVLLGLQDKSDGLIKLVTIAPEIEWAMEGVKDLKEAFRFSIGHTMADYETACKAFEAGADHVTHLYNAMRTGTHREPSVPEAAADYGNVYVELICDGVHVHPSVVRNAFRIYGDDRIVLISDSMRATGMETNVASDNMAKSNETDAVSNDMAKSNENDAVSNDMAKSNETEKDIFTLGGQRVTVNGKLATLEDGTIAGSVSNLYDCMKKAIDMGIPKESAIKAATINPARSIGVDGEVGSIEAYKRADILIVDEELRLETVIIGGKL